MKCRMILFSALALGISIGSTAKVKKTKKAKATTEIKVDTVSVDTFSYAMGMAQSEGLREYLSQRMSVDTAFMADFHKGLAQAMSNPGDKKMAAYAAGLQIGKQVMEQLVPGVNRQITDKEGAKFLNEDLFKQGFVAGVMRAAALMNSDKAREITQKQMEYYQEIANEKKYGENRITGQNFLAENAKKEGVKTTKSGLQYKILKKGTGETPKAESKVKVEYEGRLIDGTVFDSTKEGTPASFGCNQVIKGWTEALTQMPVGSEWELYIPQELAYGSRQAGKIPPFSTLIFKVKLLEIEK